MIDLHVGICSVSSSASRAGSFSTVTFRMGVWGYRPSPNSLPAIKSMLPAKKSRRPAQTEKASVLVGYTRPLPGDLDVPARNLPPEDQNPEPCSVPGPSRFFKAGTNAYEFMGYFYVFLRRNIPRVKP